MKLKTKVLPFLLISFSLIFVQCKDDDLIDIPTELNIPPPVELNLDPALVEEGRTTFRFDTYGDEAFWSGALQLDKAILGEANGGFGPGLSPSTALSLGLKVDAEALPQSVVDGITSGNIDLEDPSTTVALLSLDAVLGVKGNFDDQGNLSSVGITCALCHSTVDNSFSSGIGSRLDGWPNRDLNVGAIIASTNTEPLAQLLGADVPTVNSILNNWGVGRFPGGLLLDGIVTTPDGELAPVTLIPAAFGLQGINPVSYTGFSDLRTWGNFVAVVELGGQGNYFDPRLNDADQFPIAVARGSFDVQVDEDLVTPKLDGLQEYILSLLAPKPVEGSFDEEAAIRGQSLFAGKAQCISCHSGATFADNILRTPEEIGIDDFEASRSVSGKYRTPPLRGLFAKAKGGYFHDGRFPTLNDVVEHYDDHFDLQLTTEEQNDLVEYLNAL